MSINEKNTSPTESVVNIPIDKLKDFADHPFSVRDDDAMQQTVESIREYGVLVPAIARPLEDGTFELISGHRRKHACELAGIETMPVIVRDLDRNAAIIIMVDSNLQRENILPSEKAKAYKMKLEAIKRQGKRHDLTSTQVVSKLRSNEEIGLDTHESRETIRRYIRLTNLIPELLQKVDDGQIALTPAVELSFLQEHEQRQLLDEMGRTDATPNLSQSQRLRIFSRDGRLSPDVICAIMSEEKANQKERLRIPVDRVKKFFPKSYTTARMEEEIIKLCEAQYRRRMSREAR